MAKPELVVLYDGEEYQLFRFVTGPLRTNNYLLVKGCEAVLIDAGPEVSEHVKSFLGGGVKLKEVLLTHGHFDHVADAYRVRELTGADVVMHELDKQILNISASVAKDFSVEWSDPEITVWLRRDTEVLRPFSSDLDIKAVHTPGHTPGSVTYFIPSMRMAFTGDTLFKGVVGATHFPGGSRENLAASLRRLIRELPDDTLILPGHGGATSIRVEKLENKYLRSLINKI